MTDQKEADKVYKKVLSGEEKTIPLSEAGVSIDLSESKKKMPEVRKGWARLYDRKEGGIEYFPTEDEAALNAQHTASVVAPLDAKGQPDMEKSYKPFYDYKTATWNHVPHMKDR